MDDYWAEAETPWPSDAELDEAMLFLPELRPGELCREDRYVPFTSIAKLAAVDSEHSLQDQISALDRLTARADALVWPRYYDELGW